MQRSNLTTQLAWFIFGTLLMLAGCGGGGDPVIPATVAMPSTKIVTDDPVAKSFVFAAASRLVTPIDLSTYGYDEKEVFVTGKANIYERNANGVIVVRNKDAPYVNRIIVRMPKDASKFSGNVIVEANNPTARIDNPIMWAQAHDFIIRNGDAYVAVAAKPVAIKSLKTFNASRYGELSWSNPEPRTCNALPPDSAPDMENGLVWDILSQVGYLVRSEAAANPLAAAGLKVERVFLTGQSQSAIITRTYYNNFHEFARRDGGGPIYDGYLAYVGGATQPLNNCDTAPTGSNPFNQERLPKDAPVIRIMSQSDYLIWADTRRADSDVPTSRFRLIEIPGGSHLDEQMFRYKPQDIDIIASGLSPTPGCNEFSPGNLTGTVRTDFPMNYFVNAAFKNLELWVQHGVAPPYADRITVDGIGTASQMPRVDAQGNLLGGLRTPYLDFPTSKYSGSSTGPGSCSLTGNRTPLSQTQLHSLYTSRQDYVTGVARQADAMVAARWLLPEDAARVKDGAAVQAIP